MGERRELVPGGAGVPGAGCGSLPLVLSLGPAGWPVQAAGGAGGCLRCATRDSEGGAPRAALRPSPPVL